jgi:CO dehydrogenase/acetyl-CoA synthase beta subunit
MFNNSAVTVELMSLRSHKWLNYQQGLRAIQGRSQIWIAFNLVVSTNRLDELVPWC